MITFDDVKQEKETTYFFITRVSVADLSHFMKVARIEHTSLSYDRWLNKIPSEINAPDVYIVPNCPIKDNRPSVIISNLNADDLQRKWYEIYSSIELQQLHRNQSNKDYMNYLSNVGQL